MSAGIPASRLQRFYRGVRNVLAAKDPCEAVLFDCEGLAIFAWLLGRVPPGMVAPPPMAISMRGLAEEVLVGRDVAIRRLKLMARYGMVKVTPMLAQAPDQRRFMSTITINPKLIDALRDNAEDRKGLAKAMVALGLLRGDGEKDLQGFHSHVDFGQPEPVLLPGMQLSGDIASELFELGTAKAAEVPAQQAKRDKEAERQAKVARHGDWVTRSGNMWTAGQVALGRIKATAPTPPAWALANTGIHKRERQELCTLLEQFGGMRVGMAWMYFCGSVPILGKDNKPTFRTDIPHVQYTSDDKKPTQFAKHFSAILGDRFFQKWEDEPKKQDRIRHYFGALADYLPPGLKAGEDPQPQAEPNAWAQQGAVQ